MIWFNYPYNLWESKELSTVIKNFVEELPSLDSADSLFDYDSTFLNKIILTRNEIATSFMEYLAISDSNKLTEAYFNSFFKKNLNNFKFCFTSPYNDNEWIINYYNGKSVPTNEIFDDVMNKIYNYSNFIM